MEESKEWNRNGVEFYSDEEYEKAIECYDKAIRLDPDNVYAWNNRGLSYLAKEAFDKAIECFSEAIRIDPDYADAVRWSTTCPGWGLLSD